MNAVIVREPQNAVFLSKLASQYLIRNGRFDVVAGKAARDGPLDDYFAIDLRIPHAVDPYTIIELRDDKVECRKVSIVRLFLEEDRPSLARHPICDELIRIRPLAGLCGRISAPTTASGDRTFSGSKQHFCCQTTINSPSRTVSVSHPTTR
jgi:hypothetical protein